MSISKHKLSEGSKKWLARIASGELTMGQRKVSKVMKNDGALTPIVKAARSKGIHLLQLTDDKGNVLLAGSKEAFKVLC